MARSYERGKEYEPEDPMELRGVMVPGGDADYMLDCLIEEFGHLGWDSEHLLQLFDSPQYPPLHAYLKRLGRDKLQERIRMVLSRCGVFRVQTVEAAGDSALIGIASGAEDGDKTT